MDLFELIYKNMKNCGDTQKIGIRETLTKMVMVSINGMFEYDGLPETVWPEFLEEYLHREGTAVLEELNGEWIAATGDYADNPNVYGLGQKVKAATLNGIVSEKTPNVDCVVVWNNSHMYSDLPIINLAVDILTELFASLKSNIIYSRLKPIFRADNDTMKNAIIEAFKKVTDNDPIIVTSDNVLNKLIEGQSWEDVNVLNITDPENANKMQYLVKCVDDVLRWIYGLYGQAIQGNGKLAQQSVDEVNGDTSISFILPNNMLKQRRKALEVFNRLSGSNATVDFSKAWKTEETKYVAEADKTEAEAEKLEAEAEAAAEPQEENTEIKESEENEEVVQT